MSATVSPAQLEQLTQQLGREMFARTRAASAGPLKYEWWEERMLQQFMRYEWLKVQAFRFIDALPTLQDDVEVARHIREYFVHPECQNGAARAASAAAHGHGADDRSAALAELDPPRGEMWLYRFVSRMMNLRRLDSWFARLLVWTSRRSSAMMAKGFIAGSNIDEAVRNIVKMRRQQLAFTIDVLGESAVSAPEADAYQALYLDLIGSLPRHAAQWSPVPLADAGDGTALPRVNVSVKLTSLYPGFDPVCATAAKERAKERLRPLMRKAMEGGVHLHVDMEHYAIKDLTLEMYEELLLEPEFRDYPHFGIVLQAYLRDGDRDARRLVEFARRRGVSSWVRLVKGAYWDSETVWAAQRGWPVPVWEQKWQSDACYERMSRVLLENHELVHCAFASHNIRSLCHALALKRLLGVPGHAFEWQMLFGMGNPMKRAAVQMGERCRVYTPFGDMMPGMAYLIRRLLENTANESFLRHTGDEAAETALLENPDVIGRNTAPPVPPTVIRYEFEEPIMEPFVNVPNTDFALADNRARFAAALDAARASGAAEVPLRIAGQTRTTGQWHEARNPSAPGTVLARVAQATSAELDEAVTAAHEALRTWRRTPGAARANVLARAAELLGEQRFALAALTSLACARPWREADNEVSGAIDHCNYYAREWLRISDNMRRRDIPGEINEYFYTPRGVTAVLPGNAGPLAQLVGLTAAALVTGNTVVLRPTGPTAVLADRVAALLAEAGLPAGALNVLPGDDALAEALARHARVATVAYAGPRPLGRRLYEHVVSHPTTPPGLKKFVGELGGKNTLIIDSDADLDEAIKGVLDAAFGCAGQRRSSCERVIVVAPIYERLMGRLVEAARSKGVGPADDPATSVPPVIDEATYNAVCAAIKAGESEGRCVLTTDVTEARGKAGGAYYVAPTIFADLRPDARLAREPVGGPVLAVLKVADMDEAIRVFNDVEYALVGGIYSRSPANIERARQECECGNFYINRVVTGEKVDLQPFGGFRMSGLDSKTGGPDYLVQFCEARTVTENTLRRGFAPSEELKEVVT
jgi:RHH-type proline utilization regulon transcriptional repressor/proline dehydrogenase/delta 1-pyrroline-5-carboxylate dehydrogenase